MLIKNIITAIFILSFSLVITADEILKDVIESEEYQIGVMVQHITAAIHDPENPESLEIIVRYGMDSRYYVMIRGWLVQELAGVKSQNRAKHNLQHMQQEILLTKAIRRIDLE